jgi:hypothetical protein
MGFERKRKHYSSDAEECRQRGFKVGDRLAGNEGYGVTVIEITAIGERSILAKGITHDGKPREVYESSWTLSCRDWELVEPQGKVPNE